MIWIDNISQLSYLTTPAWADCYCELITEPNDILLQAEMPIPINNNGDWQVFVNILSPDGLTILENVDGDNFEWFVFLTPSGVYKLNIRFKRITTVMCESRCFILNVIIKRGESYISGGMPISSFVEHFNKYTERYCIDNCCLLASDINIIQDYSE